MVVNPETGEVWVDSRPVGCGTPRASLADWAPSAELYESSIKLGARRVGSMIADVTLFFHGGTIANIWLTLPLDGDVFAKSARHVAWLAETLGQPPFFHARGAMWSFAWGWVYVRSGSVVVAYPGYRGRVPEPWAAPPDAPRFEFRCMGCGELAALAYPDGVLRVGMDRGGVPCEACGAVAWVLAGSTTEYYIYSRRSDVCEVFHHPAEDVRAFVLVPREPISAPPGALTVESLTVKACPEHVRVLERDGILGFVLPKDRSR